MKQKYFTVREDFDKITNSYGQIKAKNVQILRNRN